MTQKDKKRENAKMINFDKIVKMTKKARYIKKISSKRTKKLLKGRKSFNRVTLETDKKNSALPGITS